MIVDLRTTAVSELRGVGKVRAAAYEKLGVRTVGDLLYHLPRASMRQSIQPFSYCYMCINFPAFF